MVKRIFSLEHFFYFCVALLVVLTLYLSIFELLLYTFQSPFGSNVSKNEQYHKVWVYLLEQKYESFIDLESLSIHEKRHFLDVKRLLEEVHTFWMLLSPLGVLALVLFFKKMMPYFLLMGLVFKLMIIGLFGMNFIGSFDSIHAFFFVSNSWRFPETSLIIELFPLHYFQEFLMLLMLLIFVSFMVMGFFYLLLKRG